MSAVSKIRKVGNSSAVILPKEVMQRLNLQQGDEVSIIDSENGILLSPYNDKVNRQMELATKVMRENRNMLKKLAE